MARINQKRHRNLQLENKRLQAENKLLRKTIERALQQDSLVELAEYQALKENKP